mgnify:CR=1 FL=1
MARRVDRESVPNRLREHRVALGLEQSQVAQRIAALAGKPVGIDAGMVSRHERGVSKPRPYYRMLYCKVLETDEGQLWPRPGKGAAADHVPFAPPGAEVSMDEQTADDGPLKTVTVGFSETSLAALRDAAETTGDTYVETINKAVQGQRGEA